MRCCIWCNKLSSEGNHVPTVPQTSHKFWHTSQKPFCFPDIRKLTFYGLTIIRSSYFGVIYVVIALKFPRALDFYTSLNWITSESWGRKNGCLFGFFNQKKWPFFVPLSCPVVSWCHVFATGHCWTVIHRRQKLLEDGIQLSSRVNHILFFLFIR